MEEKSLAKVMLENLLELNPYPKSELHFSNPFEIVCAVLLSAQCLDSTVNKVTPKLWERWPDAKSLSQANLNEVEDIIKIVNFYHNKAKHLISMSQTLMKDFNGQVPQNYNELVTLAGVSRKTAQVVQIEAFNIPALPVDTHIFRVTNRIFGKNFNKPIETENFLRGLYQDEQFNDLHKILVLHGRYVCKAKTPDCENCVLKKLCVEYETYYKK